MNQFAIGQYITKKRKGKNLTQEQLAEKLGVSNKTVPKWENGKCMPDYSVIQDLCQELEMQKNIMYGVLLIVMGIALLAFSKTFGGTGFQDLMSGILLGLSVGEMLVGVFVVGWSLARK